MYTAMTIESCGGGLVRNDHVPNQHLSSGSNPDPRTSFNRVSLWISAYLGSMIHFSSL